MNYFSRQNQHGIFNRTVCLGVLVTFLQSVCCPVSLSHAQLSAQLSMTQPGAVISLSAPFTPAHVTGLTINPQNPFQFDFIIDIGDDQLKDEALKKESEKLIKYFMTSLTVPDKEMWVNLSPYEKDRIMADGLAQTEMGKDLLSLDLKLKQLTASLLSPENELGNKIWKELHNTNITQDVMSKIWILPEKASVYIHDKKIFVVECHLKVMMEDEYLKSTQKENKASQSSATDQLPFASQLIKQIILPAIEKEVNEGKNFAPLRQIFYSMILATWYKRNLKQSILNQLYIDQNKMEGIDLQNQHVKEKIYNQYLEAFQNGVSNIIREDYDPSSQNIVARKYFSGGIEGIKDMAMAITPPAGWMERESARTHVNAQVRISPVDILKNAGDKEKTAPPAVNSDGAMFGSLNGERQAIQKSFDGVVSPSNSFEDLTGVKSVELVGEWRKPQGPLGSMASQKLLLHPVGVSAARSMTYFRRTDGVVPMLERIGNDRVLDVQRRFFRRLPNLYGVVRNGESWGEKQPANYLGEVLGTGKRGSQGVLEADVTALPLELFRGFSHQEWKGLSSFMVYGKKGSIRELPWSRTMWSEFIISPAIVSLPDFKADDFKEAENAVERIKKVSQITGRPISDLRISIRYRRSLQESIVEIIRSGVDLGQKWNYELQYGDFKTIGHLLEEIEKETVKKGFVKLGKVIFHAGGNSIANGLFLSDELDLFMGSTTSNQISTVAAMAKSMNAKLFSKPIFQNLNPPMVQHLKEFGMEAALRPATGAQENVYYLDDIWTENDFILNDDFIVTMAAVKSNPFFRDPQSKDHLAQGLPEVTMDENGHVIVHVVEMDGVSKAARVWKITYQTWISGIKKSLERKKAANIKSKKMVDDLYLLAGIYGRYGQFAKSLQYFDEAIKMEVEIDPSPNNVRLEHFSGVKDLFQALSDLSFAPPEKVRQLAYDSFEDAFTKTKWTLEAKITKKGMQTRWRYGASKLLAIIYESDGDQEMVTLEEGHGSLERAARAYHKALRFDPENISILTKANHAELFDAIHEYEEWENAQKQTATLPTEQEKWKKLIEIYRKYSLHSKFNRGAVFSNLAFWTVLKDKSVSERHDYLVGFRMVQRMVETLSENELIGGKTRWSVAMNIIKYRQKTPQGVFLDLGRLFIDEVKAESDFLAHLAEALNEANILKYKGDDQKARISSRTPDDALDQEIENLKLSAEQYQKEHSTQGLYYRLGEAYYRKALLLSNYGIKQERVEEYFRKSIEAFQSIAQYYDGDLPGRAQYRILEVALAAGFQKKVYKKGMTINTNYGQGEIVDVFIEEGQTKFNIQLLDEETHRVLFHVTAQEAGMIELETELGKILDVKQFAKIVSKGDITDETLAEAADLNDRFNRILEAITLKIEKSRRADEDDKALTAIAADNISVDFLGIKKYQAENVSGQKPGGIDFNSRNLELKTQGDQMKFIFSEIDPALFPAGPVNGFTPVILQITPVINFSILLGFSTELEGSKETLARQM